MPPRRYAAGTTRGIRSDARRAEVRPHRHAHAAESRHPATAMRRGDRARNFVFAGKIVCKHGFGGLASFIDAINRHTLLGELAEEISPMRSKVRAVTDPWGHVQITHLEHITGFRPFDIDRAG